MPLPQGMFAGSQASLGLPSHIARVMHRPREGSCLEGNALPRLCRLTTLTFSEFYLVQVLTGLPVNRAQHARRSVQARMRHCRAQPLATRGHELWQTADGLVMMHVFIDAARLGRHPPRHHAHSRAVVASFGGCAWRRHPRF